MRRLTTYFSSVTLGLMFIIATPNASATLIDFDTIADGTLVSAPISGVTFSLDNGHLPSVSSVASGSTSSPPHGLLNAECWDFACPEGLLTMSFDTAVSDLSFNMTFENGDIMVEVFQGAISSVVNVLFDGDPLDNEFVDLSGFSGVTAVTLSYAFPRDYFLIDDVSFNPTSVPEPATLALVGLGLAGFRFNQRRSQKQKLKEE